METVDSKYTLLYQLRTKTGNGDVPYFVETEALDLVDIVNYIVEYELDKDDYIVVKMYVKEEEVPYGE